MLEEMTGNNREAVHNIFVKGTKKKKVCARSVPQLLTPDQKHQRGTLPVEFAEMTDNDRHVLKEL
jgi:hypothetical protein